MMSKKRKIRMVLKSKAVIEGLVFTLSAHLVLVKYRTSIRF